MKPLLLLRRSSLRSRHSKGRVLNMSFTLIGKHEKDSRNNRDGYVTAMLDLMEKDSKVMHVDCDLENCINTGKLAKAFPEQTVNAGIAEANAMGVAAGLAATGRTVFMHSFGCFASRLHLTRHSCPQLTLSCRYTLSVPTRRMRCIQRRYPYAVRGLRSVHVRTGSSCYRPG